MARLSKFEHHRWVGDKRNQVVHDTDFCNDKSALDDLVASEKYLCFGPDTLIEARNRGYKKCTTCPGIRNAPADK